jgi:8-oxo-dGTP pyrophosphatase MutT (NUDIX family)
VSFENVLNRYEKFWTTGTPRDLFSVEREYTQLRRCRALLADRPDAFLRTCFEPGHFTGSAVIVTPDFQSVLLTFHGKLNKWLQLGGHADGDTQIENVALREGTEESGLTDLKLVSANISGSELIPLDIDIHQIPARGAEPVHEHFDIRFLLVTAKPDSIVISEESKDLRWFTLDEVRGVSPKRAFSGSSVSFPYCQLWSVTPSTLCTSLRSQNVGTEDQERGSVPDLPPNRGRAEIPSSQATQSEANTWALGRSDMSSMTLARVK